MSQMGQSRRFDRIGAIDALGLKLFWLRPLRPQLRSSRLKFLIFPNLWKRPKNTVRSEMACRCGSKSFTVIDVPAFLGGIGRAAAGKLGLAPLRRNNGGQATARSLSSALPSK